MLATALVVLALATPFLDDDVATLMKLVEERGARSDEALGKLCEMGPDARPALPLLLAIIQDRTSPDPEGFKSNMSFRQRSIWRLRFLTTMTWAANELVPPLGVVAGDASEAMPMRCAAAAALSGFGEAAIATLEKLTLVPDPPLSLRARASLARVLEQAGVESQRTHYARLAEANPFDPHVSEAVERSKNRTRFGDADLTTTNRVKAALHEKLAKDGDPRAALSLAQIIQGELQYTSLARGRLSKIPEPQRREDENESYVSMRRVLATGLDHAGSDATLMRKLGSALAKLALLAGDWTGMNDALARIGEAPIPAEERPWLTAPPRDWVDLRKQWQRCDSSWRTGHATIVVRVAKEGRGLAGAHVLVKATERPLASMGRGSGLDTDTILRDPQPLPHMWLARESESFGYPGKDRAMTRYAVTDASGEVRIEQLPKGTYKLEVLIPTANFPEAVAAWDLYQQLPSGADELLTFGSGASDPKDRVIELGDDTTFVHPALIVRARPDLNIKDWQPVDELLVLRWAPPPVASAPSDISYGVEMALTAPSRDTMRVAEWTPALERTSETTHALEWPVGAQGVGGMKLVPGNIYWLAVTARGATGEAICRYGPTWVWVPWTHRDSSPPFTEFDPENAPPIEPSVWWENGTLGGRIAEYLTAHGPCFEREYLLVAAAWADWLAGKPDAARTALDALIAPLPEGSVARATAQWLIAEMAAGHEPEKHLAFRAR